MADVLTTIGHGFGAPLETPTPKYVPLDQQSQGLLNDMQGQAQAPTSDWQAKATKGVDSASQLGGQQLNYQAQSGQTDAMSKALHNAYQGQAQKQIGSLVDQSKFNAQIAKANYAANINHALLGQAQTQVSNYQMLTDAYNQSEAARAQFVSAISGLANYGMGRYAAAKSSNVPTATSPDQMVAVSQAANSPLISAGMVQGQNLGSNQYGNPNGFAPNNSDEMY